MSVINTNVKSQIAQNALQVNNRSLSNAMQQLSTGKRINAAKDDAAGLAIATRMTADLRGMSMSIKNANDGISMTQTAEGALGEINNMLQRMRELSVQAATGSMTADNREAVQLEMDQLVSEIDNVAKKTNFNGIRLLDGSAKDVKIQTNVKENDQVAFTVASASSKNLGLQGFRIEGQLTTGRVGNSANVTASDVLINGKNFTTSTGNGSATAAGLAEKINANIGEHRVQATAFNTLKAVAPTTSVFSAGDVTINSTAVAAASSVEELVSNINRDVAGVIAVLGTDGAIELSNTTGNNISVEAGVKAGFTVGTYTGYVSLKSLDGEDIKIISKSAANGYTTSGAGTVADVKTLGVNETKDGTSFTGSAVSNNSITLDDDLQINGVRVGVSRGSSALDKASAINDISGQTGVTADAQTEVKVTIDMTKVTGASAFTINGKAVDIKTQTTLSGVVSAINNAGINGVVASADEAGSLILTSDAGADITVLDTSLFGTNVAAVDGETAGVGTTITSGLTVKGRINLSSDTGAEIRVQSKSTSAAALIGHADQGGSDTLVGGELSVRTQESAGRAITAIDQAIDSVAMERANLGAFQNRLTAAVDNLSSTSTNLSESRSRILDTDYAAVTTELARSQIVQQAATAMLAQANQQPQTVLALLQ